MSYWDTANFFNNSKIDNFREFIYCLDKYTYRGCSYRLLDYLINYYDGYKDISGVYKELIENFSVDEVSQLISTLCTKQGLPMFKSEEIDALIAAREFALSNDPKKRIDYLCTVELELPPDNFLSKSDELVKILVTVKVNCISNKYLKMSEEENEYYEDYLLELAEYKITKKYPLIDEFYCHVLEHGGSSLCLKEYKALS